jgi:predicted house-cleaning noncanonical NTP pyrophosphatase (MazG superfamily)
MKNAFFITSILAGSLFAGSVFAKEVRDVVPEIVKAAANPVVVKAVKAQNAKAETLAKIQEIDKSWMDVTGTKKELTEFMKSFASNAAAKELAKIEKSNSYMVEFILTDDQGANVALTGMTSDYWQGDEPKFTNAYANGKGDVYIARPQKDKSTGEVISQVSVPVMSDGKAIGTLTVGVRTDQMK